MTNHTDLIADLRLNHEYCPREVIIQAADALQAAQAEIERLQTTVKHLSDAAANATFAEKAALARLAELTKQEPVAWAMQRADGLVLDVICPEEHESHEGSYTLPLYAAAGASPVQPSQGLQSVADALTIEQLNDKVERLMAVQPSQAPTCDLRGIDAGPLSEWVDLVRRGYVAEDECLIAVKDVPKCLAQNQPSQAVELSDVTILKIATQSKVPTVVINEVVIQFARNLFAAINAKESGK